MAQDIKITIGADTQSAIKNIKDLSVSFDVLENKLPDVNKAYLDMARARDKVNNAIGASNIQKAQQELNTATLAASNITSDYHKKLSVMINAQIAANNSCKGLTDTIKGYENTLRMVDNEQKKAVNAKNFDEYEHLNKVFVNITGQMNKLKKELDGVNKSNKFSEWNKKLISILKNIMGFQLVLGTVRKALSFATNTLSDSVRVAGEAEQVYSKLNTVFNDMPQALDNVASLSSKIGVAQSTASSALSTVGDLIQAQGMGVAESMKVATEWVEKFQDIIAFKDVNMSLEEFAQNFMSGAAGNLRNFRTFGSIVKEDTVKAMVGPDGTELEKLVARANIALEQQKNAIGATNREWGTTLSIARRLTEAWKEFKEGLGESLNIVINPIKNATTELINAFNKWNKYRKEMKTDDIDSKLNSDAYYFSLLAELEDYGNNNSLKDTGDIKDNARRLKDIYDILKHYTELSGDTLDELSKDLNGGVAYDPKIRAFLLQADKVLSRDRGLLEKENNDNVEIDIAKESWEKFLETVNSKIGFLPGGEFSQGNKYGVLSEAFDILQGMGSSSFIDILEEMFDPETATLDGYKNFLEALKELGKIANNNGFTDMAKGIGEYYQSVSEEYKKIKNPEKEKEKQTKEDQTKESPFASMKESYEATIADLRYEFLALTTSTKEAELWRQRENEAIKNKLGLTEEEIKALEELTNTIAEKKDEIYKQEQMSSLKDSAYGAMGEVGTIAKAFSKGSGMLAIAQVMTDIVGKTDLLVKLSSIISDSILPTLNAFLAPLIPTLTMVSNIIQSLTQTVLAPLFPVLKGLSMAILTISACVNVTVGIIEDSVKKLVGYIAKTLYSINIFGWRPFSGLSAQASWADIDIFGNAEKRWDETISLLNDISDSTLDTATNTKKDDSYLSAYKDLYNSGLISAQTYADYVSHKYGGSYGTEYSSGGSYTKAGGNSYIEKQNVSITINGTGLSKDQLTDALNSALYGNGSFANSVSW